MQRIKALLAKSWWLWISFFATVVALGMYVEPAAYVVIPFLVALFFYFAFVRYDSEGNHRP